MNFALRLLCLLTLTVSLSRVVASPALDKAYALRNFVVLVINEDQEPVYSEHIENLLIKFFRNNGRFEFNDKVYLSFKERIRTINLYDPATALSDKIEWLRAPIEELQKQGVDGVLVAEVTQAVENYYVSLVMASTNKLEFIRSKEAIVSDRFSMDAFTTGVTEALQDLVKQIPFEGTVLRRDGYRVVLDRAAPDLTVGSEISAYTVEEKDEKFSLEETGLIKITEVGEQVTFGKILVEKKPREVSFLNKIMLTPPKQSRDLSSLSMEAQIPGREFGFLDLEVGANVVTVDNLTATGSGAKDSNHFYPGATLRGEAWITGHTFLNVGLSFAMSTINFASDPASPSPAPGDLNSNISDFRGQLGYRFGLAQSRTSPSVNLRVGYCKHNFTIDQTSDPYGFSSMSYGGFLGGAGVSFPISERFGLGFDMDVLLFPSVKETPFTSGDTVNSVTGYDFSLKALYHYSNRMDILARLVFQSFNSEFSGVGTRTIPFASSSLGSRAFSTGIAYYF